MRKLLSWFARKEPVAMITEPAPQITWRQVEAMIEQAGRQRVFDRARELGWSVSVSPPLWVWAEIAREQKATK